MSANYSKNKKAALNPDSNLALPVDEQAERAVIAAALAMPNMMVDLISILAAGQAIAHEGYRMIFSAMSELYQEGKALRVSAVLQRLKLQDKYNRLQELGISLIELPNEAYSIEGRDTAKYLRDLWVKRSCAETSLQVLQAVSSGRSVSDVVDMLVESASDISGSISGGTDRRMGEVVAEALTGIDKAISSPGSLTGVDTGLSKINRHTGGWQGTDVIMIAGRPGSGKTITGLFHAEAAAKAGVPVAYLSLEMPARSLINRMLSARTGIPYGELKKGRVDREQLQQVHLAAGELERLPIHWYDEPNKDINDLMYLLIAWKKKYNIGLVIIDYVQLMKDRTVYQQTEYNVMTSVSVKLKELQLRLNIPVIELSQLNRAVESRSKNKRPSLSDIRSTGQFEQDASQVIGLYRDDYYKDEDAKNHAAETGEPYEEPVWDNSLEYIFLKNRDGSTGTATLWCDAATNQVFDSNPENSWYRPVENAGF